MDLPTSIDGMMDFLNSAPPEQVAELRKVAKTYVERVWTPQPGPQYDAYHSLADELLYGGAAGGGKTDLLIGLASMEHQRSLIFRRMSKDLDGLWERLAEVNEKVLSTNNTVKNVMITKDGRKIEGGHLEKPGSEKGWQGRPHDLIGCDEAAQLDEFKVAFVIQWLRSTTPDQRVRLVLGTNPPLPEFVDGRMVDHGTGDWLMRWFAPWIDDQYHDPAKPGELRWCYMQQDGERLITKWVDGPGYYDVETGKRLPDATDKDIEAGKATSAKSRTFIKSLLKDNAYLKGTGYLERLSTTAEPLRSMLMAGKFGMRLEDNAMQIIPTAWVIAAQQRWHEREHLRSSMKQLVLAADIAQGGVDNTVYAQLMVGDFFEYPIALPGRETPDGLTVVRKLLDIRRDKSLIVLDGTGGWAGDTHRTLDLKHDITSLLFVASSGSNEMDKNLRYTFLNARAKTWWKFREALDPDSEYSIALPPDPRLTAQLTAPTYKVKGGESTEGGVIQVESKDDLRKRLNSSTDEADGVLMAWEYRDEAMMTIANRPHNIIERYNNPNYEEERNNPTAAPIEDEDLLSQW